MEKKSNACGSVGVCIGWAIPLAGIILGIISLARREKSVALGVLSIVLAFFFWIFWASVFIGGMF